MTLTQPAEPADLFETPSPEALAQETPSPPPPGTLRVWLPPRFDPNAQTPAAELLRARLELFDSLHTETRLEVRLKAETGPGGLLASLSSASISAPLTLPDVVALPRPLLEAASLKGIIYPLEGLTGSPGASDWYPYAVQLGYVQDRYYGVPFAADMLILAYNPLVLAYPPADWSALMAAGQSMAFPAFDPQALFTLLQYRSLAGKYIDADGRPTLDADSLVQVLSAYQQANTVSILPFWLSQYENDTQVWEALSSGEVSLASMWASHYLNLVDQATVPLAAAQIPTLGGQTYSLATGWSWALASPDPSRQSLAGELIQFLSDSDFLAAWDAASGFLPPTVSAMQAWQPSLPEPTALAENLTPTPTQPASVTATPTPLPPPTFHELVSQLSAVAELLPADDILAVLGPALLQASLDVLKQQAQPAAAAEAAIATLGGP
jgi:ABC-type glycerol-3-phosphate transport system substrate-binding protein